MSKLSVISKNSRGICVDVLIDVSRSDGKWNILADATTEDGRRITRIWNIEGEAAQNFSRMEDMMRGQLGKTSGIFCFKVNEIRSEGELPFMQASALNAIRRELAQEMETLPCKKKDILNRELSTGVGSSSPQKDVNYKTNISNHLSSEVYKAAGTETIRMAYEISPVPDAELMRSRYCIRYDLGMCPIHHTVTDSGPLFLINNGRRLALHFDCRNCEMTVTLP